MDPYVKAYLVLAGLMVLSAVLVIAHCLATDEKYLSDNWRDEDESPRDLPRD